MITILAGCRPAASKFDLHHEAIWSKLVIPHKDRLITRVTTSTEREPQELEGTWPVRAVVSALITMSLGILATGVLCWWLARKRHVGSAVLLGVAGVAATLVIAVMARPIEVAWDGFLAVSPERSAVTRDPNSAPSSDLSEEPAVEASARGVGSGKVDSTCEDRKVTISIEPSLNRATIDILSELHGSSTSLDCEETIWLLARPANSAREYPRGYCDSADGSNWRSCTAIDFPPAWRRGTAVSVRAVVIHDGHEEDQYKAAAEGNGFPVGTLPFSPVAVSAPIIATQR